MINTISWETFFVFFCFNAAFVPLVYFCLPETNGHKLEELDAIFAEAHSKGQNPVIAEKRYRKHAGTVDVVADDGEGGVEQGMDKKDNGQDDGSNGGSRSHEHKEEI